MGFNVVYSAPPALQAFGAYYAGQQAAERQSENTQAQIDAQNQAALNNAIAGTIGQGVRGGFAGHYYGQAQSNLGGQYAADGMGPPTPGDPAAYQRNMLLSQYFLGGPQAASGYIANQEQFRNRLNLQNDAQAFQGEQRQLDRNFQTSEREARQTYRTTEREAGQDFYINEQLPAQNANRIAAGLGVTPEVLTQAGQQAIIAQGGDPSTMSPQQVMGYGAQVVANQNQQRQLNIAQQQHQMKTAGKQPVYSKSQQAQIRNIEEGLSNLRFDDSYYDQATGLPTPLGIRAEQRLRSQLAQVSKPIGYQEPPPTLGESLGIVQPIKAQGPALPGQPEPNRGYESPYGEVLVNGSGVTSIQLPNGKMMTFHNDGQKTNMRVEDVKAKDPIMNMQFPQGQGVLESWVENGQMVQRKADGEKEVLYDMPGHAETPSTPKYFGFFEDEEKAGRFVLDALKATTSIKVPQYDAEGNQLQPRSPSLEEVTSALSNVLGTVSDASKMGAREAENRYQDVIANNPYDAESRANIAVQLIASGQKTISDFQGAHPAVMSAIQSRIVSPPMGDTNRQRQQPNGSTQYIAGQRYNVSKGGKKYMATFDGTKFVDATLVE